MAVGRHSNAGGVFVLYGAHGPDVGLTSTGQTGAPLAQSLTQNSRGIRGRAATADRFGRCLASGDFNHDGFDDLAIGTPGERVGRFIQAGAVYIIYGGHNGLRAGVHQPAATQKITMASPGISFRPQKLENLGASLAVGDFNHDGIDDLAIGAPAANVAHVPNAGAVVVVYGSHSGLQTERSQELTAAHTPNSFLSPQKNAEFGSALAAADANNDGADDLAIGISGQNLAGGRLPNAGAVEVIYGSHDGLDTATNQVWTQDLTGTSASETGDGFGYSLAFGDVTGDDAADLIVGVPFEDIDGVHDAGAVTVIPGNSHGGLTATGASLLDEQNVGGNLEPNSYFGEAQVLSNFNNADREHNLDLAISDPGHKTAGAPNSGAVFVLYGDPGHPLQTPAQVLTQDVLGMPDAAQHGDVFGLSLAAGYFNAGNPADLAIGIPLESFGHRRRAGAVTVVYSGPGVGRQPHPTMLDPTATPNAQWWTQNSPGIAGLPRAGNGFGKSLA